MYILAEARLSELPGAVPSTKKAKKGADAKQKPGFEVGHLQMCLDE